MVPSGAIPDLPSPEEVGLINVDSSGERDGIWYLSHFDSEWKGQQGASSIEDRRVAAAEHIRSRPPLPERANHRNGADRITAKADGARLIPFDFCPICACRASATAAAS